MCVCLPLCVGSWGYRGGFRHGRPGQLPGAALFHKTWGAARALKKKNHLGREAVFYYLSYHCVWNWQIGAPCSCRRLCSLRRCRGQILSEKREGGRGGVSQMERTRGGGGSTVQECPLAFRTN